MSRTGADGELALLRLEFPGHLIGEESVMGRIRYVARRRPRRNHTWPRRNAMVRQPRQRLDRENHHQGHAEANSYPASRKAPRSHVADQLTDDRRTSADGGQSTDARSSGE